VFCAFVGDDPVARGFYCLGISASEAKYFDAVITRENEGRNYVPFIYLNYLAVRKEHRSQKIGTVLLVNTLERCAHFVKNVGIYGVALHAINERVIKLYSRYGFRQIDDKKYPFMILPSQSLMDLVDKPS
jgi:GNAT superfamily N-acetyltransferase